MNWDFSLNNYKSVWAVAVQIGLLLIFLFIGNTIRRKVSFLKKLSIPSALIGGFLLLIVDLIVKLSTNGDHSIINTDLMKVITYHSLAIGFIAMTLKIAKKDRTVNNKHVIQNGLLTGGTYMIQAVTGILVGLIFFWVGKVVFYDTGVLLPLSFGQGPGNAMTWDINFSNPNFLSDLGVDPSVAFDSNGSVGLTLASIGFIVSAIVGVIYINIFKKKGLIKERKANEERKVSEFIDKEELDDNDSVDKMTIQICLVAIAYALAFGFMAALSFSKFTNSIAWGFNFIFGVLGATLVKMTCKWLKKIGFTKHQYINNYQMDRISGFAFDMMIIAGVATIDIGVAKKYALLIIILSVVGTIVTYVYVRLMTKICFKGYEHEMFLTNFGTLTGTASNGMILLREIDPNFETDASTVFVLSQLPAMLTVAPLLLLLNMSAKSVTLTLVAGGIFLALFVIYTVVLIVLSKHKKKEKN